MRLIFQMTTLTHSLTVYEYNKIFLEEICENKSQHLTSFQGKQQQQQLWDVGFSVSSNMVPTALLPVRRKSCYGFLFFSSSSAGFEPANLSSSDMLTTAPPRVTLFL
jgi:hypothetical protein